MEETKIIHSLDELFIYAYEVKQGATLLPMALEGDFFLTLHIEGPSWDSRIDQRSANYILSLQSVFENLISEYDPKADSQKLLVKVDNKEGSWISSADILPFLSNLVDKMADIEIFWSVVTAIGAVAGVVMWSRYQKRKVKEAEEKTKQTALEESSKIEMERQRTEQEFLKLSYMAVQALADSRPEQFSGYETPIRTIAKTMENTDTMSVEGIPDKIPADMVRKCGPRRAPRSEETVTYADGSFIVKSRRYDEGEVVLELMQGSTTIKAYLSQLDESDRSDFIASLDKHEKEDELPFSMDLQLTVTHTKRKLKSAFIMGEGLPREGKKCRTLDDILG